MNEQWHTPPPTPPYLPPAKKRGGFWKVTTLIVLVGALLLVGWTWVSGGFSSNQIADPTASTIGTASTTVDTEGANVEDDPTSDIDNDGLTLFDEQRYGTNPNDPDTDKDGYNDGQEVISGYNPNGAGRLSIEATPGEQVQQDANRASVDVAPTVNGVALEQVFSGQGSYVCQIEGGTSEKNTVTVKVLNDKVRQETPINGSTMVFIVEQQQTLYLSSFEGSKWLKLNFDPNSATASGSAGTIRGGIFANSNLILAANPTSISCSEATLGEEEFTVPQDQILEL